MPLNRAYNTPAAREHDPADQQRRQKAARGRISRRFGIGLILAFVLCATAFAGAQEPPENLAKLVAHRETRDRGGAQRVHVPADGDDRRTGRSRRARAASIARRATSSSRRSTSAPRRWSGKPQNGLKSLILTDGGFPRHPRHPAAGADGGPAVELRDQVPRRGDDGRCGLLGAAGAAAADPVGAAVFRRHDLGGQEGVQHRADGRAGRAADPHHQERRTCFPRFTTIRKPMDGKHWFPIYTYADDTLHFRTGPQRERLRIAYSNYRRFGAESTFTPKVTVRRRTRPKTRAARLD